MPSTYSTSLRLELIGNGEQAANWGNTTNTNLGTLIEQAIAGVQSIAMLDANYTLVSGNGIADEARNAVLVMTGTLTATRNVIVPTVEKFYAVRNATTNGQSIVVKTSAGTGVTLSNGFTQLMYCDGTNVVLASVPVKASDGSIGGPVIITDNSSSAALRITQTGTGNALVVEDSANPDATPFVIDASGNVGIGTSSPSDKFQVNTQDGVRLGAAGVVSYARIGSATNGESTSQISYDRATGATIISQGNTGSALTERMRIDASGNVGIGTASPSQKLTVSGGSVNASNFYIGDSSAAVAGTYGFSTANGPAIQTWGSSTVNPGALVILTSGGERMRIDSSGNVGIGTSSPAYKLDIVSSTQYDGITLGNGTYTTAQLIGFSATNDEGGIVLSQAGVAQVQILANGTSFINGGYVGIGTASPTSELDVAGVIKSQGATVDAFPSGTVMLFAQTTAPTGWTKITAHNDKALRVVSGAAGSGGSVAFTTAFASQAVAGTVGDTTLTSSQIPSHTHTGTTSTAGDHTHSYTAPTGTLGGGLAGSGGGYNITSNTSGAAGSHNHTFTTDATGGGSSHTHTFTGTSINLAVQYVDVILASKN